LCEVSLDTRTYLHHTDAIMRIHRAKLSIWGQSDFSTTHNHSRKQRLLTQERSGGGIVATAKAQQPEDIGAGRVEDCEDAKAESGPVDNGRLLLGEDSEEAIRDDEGANDITLLVLELNVANGGGGQEKKSKFGEDNVEGIRAILLDGSEDGEQVLDGDHGDETMPDREGSVDEEAVPPAIGGVVPLEVIEDKRHRGGGEEDGNEGKDHVTVVPEREPDGVQDGGNHKVPANTVNSTLIGGLEPLVNDETTEKSVDCSPSIVDPEGR